MAHQTCARQRSKTSGKMAAAMKSGVNENESAAYQLTQRNGVLANQPAAKYQQYYQ